MRQLYFTKELLTDYYENRFHNELKRVFNIEKIGDTEFIREFRSFYHCAPAAAFAFRQHLMESLADSTLPPQKMDLKPKVDTRTEENIFFLALISFMFASEEAIHRLTESAYKKEVAHCMSAFGFPWLNSTVSMELESFLSTYHDELRIYVKEEVEAIRDAMTWVEPFMLSKLIPFLKKWDNGSLCGNIRHFDILSEYLHDCISKGLTDFYREHFYNYQGLTGMEITYRNFEDYYRNRFPQHLKHYFSMASSNGNYLKILFVPYNNHRRWEDGNPGGDAKDNMMFAALFLYMTLAEQSIIKYAKESEDDFHQSTGWPLIYSGPGAGPYLHPLKMLDYAGLSPMKYEAPLLEVVTRSIFPFLRQEMFSILNGRERFMKDIAAGKRLNEAVINRKRYDVKEYMKKGEKDILELLAAWSTSSTYQWSDMLENGGMLSDPMK